MSGIDKQRIAAVRILEGMGFTFDGSTWHPPLTKPASSLTGAADTLHALLVRRADDRPVLHSAHDSLLLYAPAQTKRAGRHASWGAATGHYCEKPGRIGMSDHEFPGTVCKFSSFLDLFFLSVSSQGQTFLSLR